MPSLPPSLTPLALVPIAWFLLTLTVNSLAHWVTPQDADAWAERQPRLAWLLAMARRGGIEPVAFLTAVYAFFARNPPPPGQTDALGRVTVPSLQKMAAKRGMGEFRAIAGTALLACATFLASAYGIVFGVSAASTACTPAQGAILQSGLTDDLILADCILQTAIRTGGNVESVAKDCGTTALRVAQTLYTAATLPKGEGPPLPQMVTSANVIRSTPAFADAYANYPQAAP